MMPDRRMRNLAARILALPVLAYRSVISPFLPTACRFQPTCSEYALIALREHGPIRGSWLAIRRLLRCHPVRFLGGGEGYDPPPRCRETGR